MSNRIAIDMDEVLADTLSKHLAMYNLEHGDTLTKQDLEGKFIYEAVRADPRERRPRVSARQGFFSFFGDFRGILSRAEIEFAEEEKDSGSEVVEGTEAARIGLDGLDA